MPYKKGTKSYKDFLKRRSRGVQKWRLNTKDLCIICCGGKCQICDYVKFRGALEFHHLDPTTKKSSIGMLLSKPQNKFKIAEELKKCVLLCSNCHREVEAGITELPEKFAKFNEELFFKSPKKSPPPPKVPVDRRKLKMTNAELRDMLKQKEGNFSALARELNVSDNAIRKRLKKDEIFV